MKFNKISIFAGLVATSTLALSAIPANAYTLNPNGTITFNKATKLDFTFLESRGKFRSDFGIYDATNMNLVATIFSEKPVTANKPNDGYDPGSNDGKNDWLGTCGVTVNPCTAWYMFAPGTYKFGLTAPAGATEFTAGAGSFDEGVAIAPGANTGPMPGFISDADEYWRSTVGPSKISSLPGGKGVAANWAFQKLDTSKYEFFVAINDSNKIDGDVQDMIVGVKKTPEPATLGGLALVGGAMAMIRRRKENKA